MSQIGSKYIKSSYRALSLLNKPCLSLAQLHQIQSHLIISAPFAAGNLISLLLANSDHANAHSLFRILPNKSAYLWNTMIRVFVENNEPNDALLLYKRMVGSGFFPNNYTFSFVLRACTELCDVLLGVVCHAQVVKLGWEAYDFVQNGLIHFYATGGVMDSARRLFDVSLNRDVVTLTAVVIGYAKCGEVGVARELFGEMPVKNVVSWS